MKDGVSDRILTGPGDFEPETRIKELIDLIESGFKQAAETLDEDKNEIILVLPGVFSKSDRKTAIKMYKEVGWKEVSSKTDKEAEQTEFTFIRNSCG
jgi:hypothetical protein